MGGSPSSLSAQGLDAGPLEPFMPERFVFVPWPLVRQLIRRKAFRPCPTLPFSITMPPWSTSWCWSPPPMVR